MCRLLLVALTLALVAPAVAADNVRNGRISFWSDRAFDGRAQIFDMNPDGTDQRRLTSLFSAKRGATSRPTAGSSSSTAVATPRCSTSTSS